MIDIHVLSQELKILQSLIEENGGEITPDIEAAFFKAYSARDQQLEALAQLVKSTDAEELIISAEIKRLQGLREETVAKGERLEKMIRSLLPVGESYNSGLHKIAYRTSYAVEVEDGVELPEVYYRTKLVSEVDRQKLAKDLKGGAEIPGAAIATRFNLTIK